MVTLTFTGVIAAFVIAVVSPRARNGSDAVVVAAAAAVAVTITVIMMIMIMAENTLLPMLMSSKQ